MTFVLSLLWMNLQRGRPLFLPGRDRQGGVGGGAFWVSTVHTHSGPRLVTDRLTSFPAVVGIHGSLKCYVLAPQGH